METGFLSYVLRAGFEKRFPAREAAKNGAVADTRFSCDLGEVQVGETIAFEAKRDDAGNALASRGLVRVAQPRCLYFIDGRVPGGNRFIWMGYRQVGVLPPVFVG